MAGLLLNYNYEDPARNVHEEWKPHATESSQSLEWWYLTTLFYDASGNPYFLVWCIFNFNGSDWHPQGVAVPEGHRLASVLGGFSDYNRKHHFPIRPKAIIPGEAMWDENSNLLKLDGEGGSSRWSYAGDRMQLDISTPLLNARLTLDNAEQIMWAKDVLNREGLIQEGPAGELSFYYSLANLKLQGTVDFEDANGKRRVIEVQGPAWVDRQWGDFMTKTWEWTSMRFDNGARLNLYNFYNGHQVATYQTASGETRWLPAFAVEQNGYVKAENGIWMSWGWTYEFQEEIEGCRRLRLEPYSRSDTYISELNTLFEGASRIFDDRTGEQIGTAVSESMDIRKMENEPYGRRQL